MGLCSHILHLHQRDTEGAREGDDVRLFGSLHQFLSTQIQHRHGQHHPLLCRLCSSRCYPPSRLAIISSSPGSLATKSVPS